MDKEKEKEMHIEALEELLEYYNDQYRNIEVPNPYDSDPDFYNKKIRKVEEIEKYMTALDFAIDFLRSK